MEYLKIGTIVNTRGIKGELKIKSFTDFQSDRYQIGNQIYILYENKYLEFTILTYKSHNNMDLIVLKGYEDINLIERYKGCDIFVSSDSEITLMEDEYHLSEIVGLKVYQNGVIIGEVYDVKAFPQGDYIDLLLETKEHALIPFRDEFIKDVDLENEFIEIVEMEGLL